MNSQGELPTPGHKRVPLPLITFFLSGLLFLLLLASNGIFPFGKLSLLISDMNSQYIDFMMEYRRVLAGQGSLFYSWHAGLGMNFLAIIAYYLASPFNLLLLLFPERNIIDAVTLITGLKLTCAAAAMSWYLNGISRTNAKHRNNALLLIGFGLLYGFSGYTVAYSFNIMWLDGVILLPLLCGVMEQLNQRNRWVWLTLLFTILLLSQFYIAYMVILFCGLYAFIQLAIESQPDPKEKLGFLLKVGGSLALAAGMSLFLLLPTFFVLKNNMGLIGQAFPDWGTNFSLPQLLIKGFPGTFDGVKGNLPHVFTGLITFFGVFAYFFSEAFSKKERILYGLLLVILIVSFWLKPLAFIWHALDHPSWFPYRNAFLLTFLSISLAYRGIAVGGQPRKLTLLLQAVLLAIVLAFYRDRFNEATRYLAFFSGLLIILYPVLLWRYDSHPSQTAFLLVALMLIECALNANGILSHYTRNYLPRQTYLDFYDRNREALFTLLPADGEFYRLEKSEIRTYNDPMSIGYPGIGHFSSTASTAQSRFLKKMGFDCYATWCMYRGGTVFSDALLGIRYLFTGDQTGNRFYRSAGAGIQQNPYVLPPLLFLDDGFESLPSLEPDQPIEHQEQIMQALLKAGKPYTKSSRLFPSKLINLTFLRSNEDGDVYAKVNSGDNASLVYTVQVDPTDPSYLFLPNISLNYDVWLDGEQIFSKSGNYTPFLVDLTSFEAGSDLELRIELADQTEISDDVTLYSFDYQQISEMVKVLSRNFPVVSFDGRTGFTAQFQPADHDRAMLTSIPFDAGWMVQIDGEKAEIKKVLDGLIGIIVPAHTQRMEIAFLPYGFQTGATLSAVSLFIFAILIGISSQNKIKKPLTAPHQTDPM